MAGKEGGKLSEWEGERKVEREREGGRKFEREGERERGMKIEREGGPEGWGGKDKYKRVGGERKRLQTERGLILVNDLM